MARIYLPTFSNTEEARVFSRNLLELQILRSCLRPIESKYLGVRPRKLCFNESSRKFRCLPKFKNHWNKGLLNEYMIEWWVKVQVCVCMCVCTREHICMCEWQSSAHRKIQLKRDKRVGANGIFSPWSLLPRISWLIVFSFQSKETKRIIHSPFLLHFS